MHSGIFTPGCLPAIAIAGESLPFRGQIYIHSVAAVQPPVNRVADHCAILGK